MLLFEHFYTFCFCSSISTATNWSFNLIVAMTFLFLTQWLTRCENSHPRFHLNLDFPSGQNRDFLILGQVWCLLSLRRPGAPWLGHFSTSPARNPGEVSAKHHLSSFQRIIKVPFLGHILSGVWNKWRRFSRGVLLCSSAKIRPL